MSKFSIVKRKASKYLGIVLCAITLIVMIFPIDIIYIESKHAIIERPFSYYSIFAFRYGIVFPFICMILTAISFILIILSLLRVIHPIASVSSTTFSFLISLLYLIINKNFYYLTIVVMLLELATVVFTFPLMWLNDEEKMLRE